MLSVRKRTLKIFHPPLEPHFRNNQRGLFTMRTPPACERHSAAYPSLRPKNDLAKRLVSKNASCEDLDSAPKTLQPCGYSCVLGPLFPPRPESVIRISRGTQPRWHRQVLHGPGNLPCHGSSSRRLAR